MTRTMRLRTYASRRRRAMGKAASEKVQALLVSRMEDVSYLSGFSGEDAYLLVGRGWACLLTDGRFGEQAPKECPGVEIHVRSKSLAIAAAEVLKGRGVRRLGLQSGHMTLSGRDALAKGVGERRPKPIGDLIDQLRTVKDAQEIRAIRKAIRIAEEALLSLLAGGKKAFVGKTERQIAAELDYRMRLAGADRPSFEPIVAAGANGSMCHYQPGSRRVREGDALLIDWGAMAGGYCSDLTRVLFMGRISAKLGEIYDVVLRAQAAGIAALRPGASCKTPDAAARKVIEAAGYGKQFVHGLGHGIGRQIHEAPGLSRTSTARLRAGMVVTVEPGIYLPGVGGVRIEDDVEITADGRRRLSRIPRTLSAMVLQ